MCEKSALPWNNHLRDWSFSTGGRGLVFCPTDASRKIATLPRPASENVATLPKHASKKIAPHFTGPRNKDNFNIPVMFFHDPPPKTVMQKHDPYKGRHEKA